jgi:hypothetical protein
VSHQHPARFVIFKETTKRIKWENRIERDKQREKTNFKRGKRKRRKWKDRLGKSPFIPTLLKVFSRTDG